MAGLRSIPHPTNAGFEAQRYSSNCPDRTRDQAEPPRSIEKQSPLWSRLRLGGGSESFAQKVIVDQSLVSSLAVKNLIQVLEKRAIRSDELIDVKTEIAILLPCRVHDITAGRNCVQDVAIRIHVVEEIFENIRVQAEPGRNVGRSGWPRKKGQNTEAMQMVNDGAEIVALDQFMGS